MNDELSSRKKKLLYNAIDNYIKVASPITSLLVKQSTLHDLSTATIRNELNALEAMGYLKQLHTSSGRVPTSKGYRFFVDETLKETQCDEKNLKKIRNDLYARTGNLSEIVDSISNAVLGATNYPTVFMFDGFENLVVQDIRVVFLLKGQVLVLIETNIGAMSSTIASKDNITKQDCDTASNVFNNIFVGKTIGFLMQNMRDFNKTIKQTMSQYEDVFKLVLQVLDVYYKKTKSSVQGVTKLLNSPDLKSIDKAKDILEILEDDNNLLDVMETGDDITIDIGDETGKSELSSCAVIKAPIVYDGQKIATVGVIGPDRIDYASVASVLKIVSDEIKNLSQGEKNGRKKEEWERLKR